MKKIGTLFFFVPVFVNAQVYTNTWGVEDTTICLIKSTNFVMVHDYIEMYNTSGNDLQMQWEFFAAPDWPVEWEAGFTDPDSIYTNVLVEDTGQFLLPYPVEFSNKLIINVDHNNHIDTSYLKFKVYPVSFPADTLWLTYCIIITTPDLSSGSVEEQDYQMFYNQVEQKIFFKHVITEDAIISVYDVNGKLILERIVSDQTEEIFLAEFEKGIYLVKMRMGNFEQVQKIVVT